MHAYIYICIHKYMFFGFRVSPQSHSGVFLAYLSLFGGGGCAVRRPCSTGTSRASGSHVEEGQSDVLVQKGHQCVL